MPFQETTLFSTWPTSRAKTNSGVLSEMSASLSIGLESRSAHTEYERSGLTTIVPPGGSEDVSLPFGSRSMVLVVIGVIRTGAYSTRVQLIGRKYFDMGTILVLQPPCLFGPFLYELAWPCPDYELYQVRHVSSSFDVLRND